jgi:hypothetical protein
MLSKTRLAQKDNTARFLLQSNLLNFRCREYNNGFQEWRVRENWEMLIKMYRLQLDRRNTFFEI